MIDIEDELRRMSKEFNIPEKEVATNFRQAVRSMWSDSVFKKEVYKKSSIRVKNENPKSMKRFPMVTKYKCAICGEYFTAPETELDHVDGEQSMLSISDAENFIKSIFFTTPSNLQIVCKDKKRKVKGKSEVVRFGCHSIKTFSERYGVTFEQAKLEKEYIAICKDKQKLVDALLQMSVESIPKTQKAQKELLRELMFGENDD